MKISGKITLMTQRIPIAACLVLPTIAYAQTAPRPDHTLSQYQVITAANSNISPLRITAESPCQPTSSSVKSLSGELLKDRIIPCLYADGNAGTLKQIGRMADGSVQQTDIGNLVPALLNGSITAPLSGEVQNAKIARNNSYYHTTSAIVGAGGSGYSVGDIVSLSDGSLVSVASENNGIVTSVKLLAGGASSIPIALATAIGGMTPSGSRLSGKDLRIVVTQTLSIERHSRSLSDALSEYSIRARDFGLTLNGHGSSVSDPMPNLDPEIWQARRNGSASDVVTMPVTVKSYPTDFQTGQAIFPENYRPDDTSTIYMSPVSIQAINGNTYLGIDSDNDLTISPYNRTLMHYKHTKNARIQMPLDTWTYINDSPNILGENYSIGKMYNKIGGTDVYAYNMGVALGSLFSGRFNLVEASENSHGEYSDQDVGLEVGVKRAGKGSVWSANFSNQDYTFHSPSSWAQVGLENDMGGSGPDKDAGDYDVLYNPDRGSRQSLFMGINAQDSLYYGHSAGTDYNGILRLGEWSAHSTFATSGAAAVQLSAGTPLLRVKASDGRYHVYKATASATTGSTQPPWGTSPSLIHDGTGWWEYKFPYSEQDDKSSTYGQWVASTTLVSGTRIAVILAGRRQIFEFQAIGRTGAAHPFFIPGKDVRDGNLFWRYVTSYAYGASRSIFIDSGNYNRDSFAYYYSGITTNASFANAFIDSTRMECIDPSSSFTVKSDGTAKHNESKTCATLRMAPGQKIDFSGQNSKITQNLHVLSYVPQDNMLEYLIGHYSASGMYSQSAAFKFASDGSLWTAGSAYIGRDGTTSSDVSIGSWSTATSASLDFHSSGSSTPDAHITSNARNLTFSGQPVVITTSLTASLANMTRQEIKKISNPAVGMEIYDTTDNTVAVYTPSGWKLTALSALPDN